LKGSTLIVAWEGTDGSGKTTLMRSVARILALRGLRVYTYKTPGPSPSGRFAARYGNRRCTPPLTRMLLYLANTVDETARMIRRIEGGSPDFLFIDRYYLCSLVYGLALIKHRRGVSGLPGIGELMALVERVAGNDLLRPDLYVIVDVDEEERLRRVRYKRGPERALERDSTFQGLVRDIYEEFSSLNPGSVFRVVNEAGRLGGLAHETADKLAVLRESLIQAGSTGKD